MEDLTTDEALTVDLNHLFAKAKGAAKGSLATGGLKIVVPQINTEQLSRLNYMADAQNVSIDLKRSGMGICIHISENTAG